MANDEALEKIELEEGKPLSESLLWLKKREYMLKEGNDAWLNVIPYEATCNPFTANAFAQILFSYIKDCLTQSREAAAHPFYILELGAGTGKFSFYCVRALSDLIKQAGLKEIKFHYIISDISNQNFANFQKHPDFQLFIQAGVIDFAVFDMESRQPMTLEMSKKTLSKEDFVNPLITIANNTFESAPCDVFHIEKNVVQPVYVSLYNHAGNEIEGNIKDLDQVEVHMALSDLPDFKYEDSAIDSILSTYRDSLQATNVTLPITVIRTIQYLNALSDNKLFVIATGTGYGTLASLDHLNAPDLNFYGNTFFNMLVNFNALALYCKQLQGDAYIEDKRQPGLETAVLMTGCQLADLPETRRALGTFVDGMSAGDMAVLDKQMLKAHATANLETLITHLSISLWPATTFEIFSNRIDDLVKEAEPELVAYLSDNMQKIAANYFDLPDSSPMLLAIGYYLQMQNRFPEAIKVYESGLVYNKSLFYFYYNLGLSYYAVGDKEKSQANFDKALAITPDSEEVKNALRVLSQSESV